MIAERFPELVGLPLEEKRIVLSELCEEIVPSSAPDPEIVKILEKRWKDYQTDPSGGITLEEFRRRIGVS